MATPFGSASSSTGGGAIFATTRWTIVLNSAQSSDAPGAHDALAMLCRAYWPPLYSFVRRRGYGVEESQDLVQAFFMHLLSQHALAAADPSKGRFRTFLLAALENFLSNERDRALAQKRGGAHEIVSFDAMDCDELDRALPSDAWSPEKAFDVRWALTVLDRALARLREESIARGKERLFEALQVFLTGEADRENSYQATADALGLPLAALKTTIHRMRQGFRALVRQEIAHTVSSPGEVDSELQHLRALLAESAFHASPIRL